MIKKIFLLALLISTPAFSQKIEVNKNEDGSQSKELNIFEKMQKFSDDMREAFEAEFNKINSEIRSNSRAVQSDIKEDDDFIIINIQVPNINEKGITIDAKKSKLKGHLKTENGSEITFSIEDGNIFTLKTDLKKESTDKNSNMTSYESSYFRRNIPSKVENLEDTKVELSDGILKIKLPKAKSGWKKIEVN